MRRFGPAGRDDLVFRVSGPERPLELHDGDGMDGVGSSNGGSGGLRQADVLYLAVLHQLLQLAHLVAQQTTSQL